jgi:steroid 5-alpha reductase family enzyme
VLFVHKYSGGTVLDSVISISLGYFVSTASMIYAQTLTRRISEPPFDLKYPRILLFFIGISGNFYHHYLLSKLRGEGEREYRIPKGGLFELVICPHYLFEIMGFLGVSFIYVSDSGHHLLPDGNELCH